MKVNIRIQTTGKVVEVDTEPEDTVEQLKEQIESLEAIPVNHQRFIYGGKMIEDTRTLEDYGIVYGATIDLIPRRVGGQHMNTTSSHPVETVFPSKDQANASIAAWKPKTDAGYFDADLAIVNPHAYYARLASLEQDAIEASEFFMTHRTYASSFSDKYRGLIKLHLYRDLEIIPHWMSDHMHGSFSESSTPIQHVLSSIWTSYLLLCRVLATFENLSLAEFCGDYYSMLLECEEGRTALIFKISRAMLEELKLGFETATALICDDELELEQLPEILAECVEDILLPLLDELRLSRLSSARSIETTLALARSVVLLMDLALVSYVGSHASSSYLEYVEKELKSVTVDDGVSGSLHFTYHRRRLACLDGFIDKDEVWTFRCGLDSATHNLRKTLVPMSILTHIEEFADIWGPVWSIPAGAEALHGFQHHHVSKGVICPVDGGQPRSDGAIRCHWYDWQSFERRRMSALTRPSKPQLLTHDDLLLIGARFRENEYCHYTLDEFETTYGQSMGVLGTECSFWEYDERQASLSFSRVIGIQISGTQKRRPQTSLKEAILTRWKLSPQTANPAILNQYLGLEVSHCTGNARRVPLKRLLLLRPIRTLLELQFPGWTKQAWGAALIAAAESDKEDAIFDIWFAHKNERSDIAALVSYVLEILDKTGNREAGLVAAFLNNRQEASITFEQKYNDWAGLLGDSHLMATYAVVGDVCIECHTPDHTTAICGNTPAYTALDTRVAVRNSRPEPAPRRPFGSRAAGVFAPDLVKMEPHGQVLKTVTTIGFDSLFMIPSSSAAAAGAHMLSSIPRSPVQSGVEIRDLAAKGGDQYRLFLRSSTKSHGGMKVARVRTVRQPNQSAVSNRGLMSFDSNASSLVPSEDRHSNIESAAGKTIGVPLVHGQDQMQSEETMQNEVQVPTPISTATCSQDAVKQSITGISLQHPNTEHDESQALQPPSECKISATNDVKNSTRLIPDVKTYDHNGDAPSSVTAIENTRTVRLDDADDNALPGAIDPAHSDRQPTHDYQITLNPIIIAPSNTSKSLDSIPAEEPNRSDVVTLTPAVAGPPFATPRPLPVPQSARDRLMNKLWRKRQSAA